jgi:hypothetical protein
MLGRNVVAFGILKDCGEVRLAVAYAWMLFLAKVLGQPLYRLIVKSFLTLRQRWWHRQGH